MKQEFPFPFPHHYIETPVDVTITRRSGGSSDPEGRSITITIGDERSRIKIIEVEIPAELMMLALTGHAFLPAKGKVNVSGVVGKYKVTENRKKVLTPEESESIGYDRKKGEQFLIDNCQEEGWYVDPALGSQRSVGYDNDTRCKILNYSVFKYVDALEYLSGNKV